MMMPRTRLQKIATTTPTMTNRPPREIQPLALPTPSKSGGNDLVEAHECRLPRMQSAHCREG
jgi:hypothetical protein